MKPQRLIGWSLLIGLALSAACTHRWRVAACTANEQGQCARALQHGPERRVTRGALPQDFTERFTECREGFARVELDQQSDDEVIVRVRCRAPDPGGGGGVVLPTPEAPAPTPEGAR